MPDHSHVLIVDDQPHLMLALEYLVRQVSGVHASTADDVLEAVHRATTDPPDLVILSDSPGPVDALTAARMIRDRWDGHPGRIWLSAGRLTDHDRDAIAAAGIDHVITHPYDPNDVIDHVRHALRPGRTA